MSDNGFYHGSGLNISNAPMGQMQAHGVEAFAQKDMLQASANRANAVSGVLSDIEKLKDYKAGAEADMGMGAADAEVQNDVRKGFEAAPGTPNSFYFEDGQLDESKINEVIERAKERLQAIQPKFFDAGRAAKWEADRDRYLASMAVRIKGQADSYQLRAIRGVSEATMQGHLTAGRWDEALSEVDKQLNAGILSPAQASLKRQEIDKASAGEEVAYMLDMNPVGLAEKLDSGAYDSVFSYGERQRVRQQIRSKMEASSNSAVQQAVENGSMGFRSVLGGKEGESLREFMENTGDFTQQEINWRVRQFYGQDVSAEMTEAARNEAMAFDIDGDMDEQREKFMSKYTRLGLKQEKLNTLWKDAEDARSRLTTVDIDANALLTREAIAGRTLLAKNLTKEMLSHLEKRDEKGNAWAFVEGGHLRKDPLLMELIGAKEDDDPQTLEAKYVRYQHKVMAQLTQGRIISQFNSWRKFEGKDASPLAQYEKLRLITKTLTGRDLAGGESVSPAATQVGDSNTEYEENLQRQRGQRARWNDDRKQQKEGLQPAPLLDFDRPQQVTLAFDSTKKDAPVGVLVPKSWMEGVAEGQASVEATFDNEHFRVFPVVGTCEGDVPVMTHATAVQGGWNLQGAYQASVRFMHGSKVPEIVSQQAALVEQAGQAKAMRSKGGMGSVILAKEARLDSKGNLAVHYLPAADGGGAYEVAGINEKSHPEMARKLKGLVETGQHEAARQQAERYIMQYTQPAADWLRQGGVQDAGVELFMRDVYMNGGPGGAKKVLNRVLGLPDDSAQEQTTQKLQEFMKQSTPRQLLDALRDKRLAWYEGIARSNPAKQQFLQGWKNRANSMHAHAVSDLT